MGVPRLSPPTFVNCGRTRYEKAVVVKDGKAQDEPSSAPSQADETPISTSGIVAKTGAAVDEAAALKRRHRRRDSDPPSYRYLTPYQARLDVERWAPAHHRSCLRDDAFTRLEADPEPSEGRAMLDVILHEPRV